jgi:acetyltransferase-like isoleucine patch superfamily enzyme
MASKINNLAVVETNEIGEGIQVDEFSIIRNDVVIGKNVHIFPNVVIESGVVIGDNVRIYPGTYIGKIPDGAGSLARAPKFSKNIGIGSNCAIGPNAIIYYDVEIGSNTLVGDMASIRESCLIGKFCVIGRHVSINYNVSIGNYTKIMDFTWLAGNMKIGDNVFISGGVMTSNDNKLGEDGYNESHILGPSISDFAKIGVGAILLPQLTVGKNAIVGAGSVVTKDVPEKAVVMGIPAKIVKYLNDI